VTRRGPWRHRAGRVGRGACASGRAGQGTPRSAPQVAGGLAAAPILMMGRNRS
jgi:hypothetical protein